MFILKPISNWMDAPFINYRKNGDCLMGPLSLMELHKDEFTAKELEVYEIIHDNYALISGSTATVFAKNFGISQSVLSRFCKKLGYSGYGELRMAMYQIPDGDERETGSAGGGTHPLETMSSSVSSLAHNLGLALDLDQLRGIARRLLGADRIYTLGQGMSMVSANALAIQLLIRSLPAIYLNPGVEAESLHCMTDRDVTVIFAVRNPTFENFIETIRELPKDRRPYTLLVTLSPKHPHAKYVSETVTLPRSTGGAGDVNLSSLYPMLFFGTYLLQMIGSTRASGPCTE